MNRHRCPGCHSEDCLWEAVTVPGWQSVDTYLRPSGSRDVEWQHAERETWTAAPVGCSCGWEGRREELQVLGVDGEPLPAVHPDQLQLAA